MKTGPGFISAFCGVRRIAVLRPGVVRRLALAAVLASGAALPVTALEAPAFLPVRAQAPAPQGAAGLCERYGWACAAPGQGSTMPVADLDAAGIINRRVNRAVREIADSAQYGRGEYWALPSARGGDCEDFALLKKHEMIRAGFPAGRLLIATALDRARRPHAVLVVRTEGGDYVMDSQDDRIRRWSATGYVYLRMQDPAAPARWVTVYSGG